MTDIPQHQYNPAIHHRRSIRLQGYDYSQAGAYFITICTHNRECLFGTVGAGSKPAPTGTRILPEIVRQLKTFSARRINQRRGVQGLSVWQRNYYEHIIRDEKDLTRIREYIANNPVNWLSDENYREMPRTVVAENFSVTVKSRRGKEGNK